MPPSGIISLLSFSHFVQKWSIECQPLEIYIRLQVSTQHQFKNMLLFLHINQKGINSKVLFKELASVLPSFVVPSQTHAASGWAPVHL